MIRSLRKRLVNTRRTAGTRDVPPVSGVIYTEGKTASLKVSVDVAVV